MHFILSDIMDYFLYISILLTTVGILTSIIYKTHQLFIWSTSYFVLSLSLELFSQIYPLLAEASNVYLISISSFINFTYLLYLYLIYFYILKWKKVKWILLVGLIPLGIQFIIDYRDPFSPFQPYDKTLYSLFLLILGMFDIYLTIAGKVKYSRVRLLLSTSILIFFSIEFILSIPSSYLVIGKRELVAGFWFFRALILQAYYIILILFVVNSDRIISSLHTR